MHRLGYDKDLPSGAAVNFMRSVQLQYCIKKHDFNRFDFVNLNARVFFNIAANLNGFATLRKFSPSPSPDAKGLFVHDHFRNVVMCIMFPSLQHATNRVTDASA